MEALGFRIGVLDQAPIAEGSTAAAALHNSLDLAALVDRLGYTRYWVAEHHASPMAACGSPEVLIAAIAARTQSLRVGSGGVLLPHYSALKVAETFGILGALHPGRIDLGIGRAPGTDMPTALALQRNRQFPPPDDFREQLGELVGYLEGAKPSPALANPAGLPAGEDGPQLWLLGGSPQSAIWAAELGLPYIFGDFFTPQGPQIVELYRQRFQPTPRRPEPRVMVSVIGDCAETDEEAERLASSRYMTFSILQQGRQMALPPPEKASRYLESEGVEPAELPGRRGIVGSPARVREGLEQLAAAYGAEEVLVTTMTYEHAARRRSYELIADACGLQPAAPS